MMGSRMCPEHGWIETNEYSPDEYGELRCDECGTLVTGFRVEWADV